MSNYRLIVIALLAVSPTLVEAQFTTFIPPKSKAVDSVAAVVVEQQKVHADSVARMRLTDMKTWVDSAAGIVSTPMTAADSLAVGLPSRATTPIASITPRAPAPRAPTTTRAPTVMDTLTMQNGSRAPATASALPLAALAGVLTVSLGLVLLGRKRPVAPARARARRRA